MTVLFFICSRLSTTLLLQAGTNDSTGFHYTPVVEFEVRFQKTREITRVKKNHVSENAMYLRDPLTYQCLKYLIF